MEFVTRSGAHDKGIPLTYECGQIRGQVTAVNDGRVSFRLEAGRMLDMNPADPYLRHIDRVWASTVHAFQGRTVDTVVAAIEAYQTNLANQKMLYVEISRARDRAEFVTDDKAALREPLQVLTGERTAGLERIREMAREALGRGVDPARTSDIHRTAEPNGVGGMIVTVRRYLRGITRRW